jgi:peptidoglycan/LPS O-acetylase OafA/YrhL
MHEPSPVLRAPALVTGYSATMAGTLLIFLGVLGAPAQAVPGWLRYLGKISYGLYVYHMLMFTVAIWATARAAHLLHLRGAALVGMKVVTPLVALAFTVCVAAASYRWLESPFLRLRKRFTVVANRPI